MTSNTRAIKNLAKCCTIFQIFGLLHFSIKKLTLKTVNTRLSLFYTLFFIAILLIFTAQGFFILVNLEFEFALNANTALSYIMHQLLYILLVQALIIA